MPVSLSGYVAVVADVPAVVLLYCVLTSSLNGQDRALDNSVIADGRLATDILTVEQWRQVDEAVDRGLAWTATQQNDDGAFLSNRRSGQPGITSLCVMAFLSRGHQPGSGEYGRQLSRAVDYVLSCQREGGLLCLDPPAHVWQMRQASHTSSYNHSISGVMLGEAYGMTAGEESRLLATAIEGALHWSRDLQNNHKVREVDRGGVRYLHHNPADSSVRSDLSATAWHLTFYRSAKNAGFDVPQRYVDEATAYARRCHLPNGDAYRRLGAFSYTANQPSRANYAMTGCGIITLALAGKHHDPMALDGGQWLLERPILQYDDVPRFAYASYYCSQAMAQLGGKYWDNYYPSLALAMVEGQQPDGSWISRHDTTRDFGRCYPTSMAILALTPAYQLLPIYQR